MTDPATPGPFTVMVPLTEGRSYRSSRRVRLGDVTPSGEVRLDAVARYLQDVAGDDVDDAGINGEAGWVVRRTTLEVVHRPVYEDRIDLVTWCSGTGAAWAERRTTVSVAGRAVIEASSLWVCMDPLTMRPKPLDGRFFVAYGWTSHSRSVPSRLRLPAAPPAGATPRIWALRRADFDVLGHVNNAIAWTVLEQEVSRAGSGQLIVRAQTEYRHAIDAGGEGANPGDLGDLGDLGVVSVAQDGVVGAWILDGAGVGAVAAVLLLSDSAPGSVDR
ncbi:MAG: thioesterase [Actinomycetota bacterium]|nr:thioesterase [Actinomycetota bacterium]